MLVAGASDHMWKRQNKIYCHIFLPYNLFIFLIEVQLIYVLVSGIQQSDSVSRAYIQSDSFPLQVIVKY